MMRQALLRPSTLTSTLPRVAAAQFGFVQRFQSNAAPLKAAAQEEPSLEDAKKHMTGIARVSSVIMESASGMYMTSTDGRKYIDFSSGIGVTSTGHCHPKVTEAAVKQAATLVHCQLGVAYHEPMLKLINRLLPMMPDGLDTFFFCNSGAEAAEGSVKVARHATKRNNIIVFQGSFHGRTYGAMALTTSKSVYSSGFASPMPSVFVAPYPYMSQMPKGITESQMTDYCISHIERMLQQQTAPQDTAAMLIEPILGEGGYVVPPKDFFPRLRKLCDKHGILLIADEVQSGFGRTGKMFAIEHFGVTPDIMVMAKGLASGWPLSAIAARGALTKTMAPGSMGGTYAGNAVSCAAALATLDVIEEERLVENARIRGEQLMAGLKKMAKNFPVKEVRGHGLMVAMEFDEKVPYGTASNISKKLLENGMILFNCSIFETIRFIPALTVTKEEIDLGLQKTEMVLKEVFAK